MKEIEEIAQNLFDKIRSRFSPIKIADEENKSVNDESEARFFNFNFKTFDGAQHGIITVSIIDGKSIDISYTQDIDRTFTSPEHELEWSNFLRGMRQFARRNLMTFNVKDITKTNLTKRDMQQRADKQKNLSNKGSVSEGIQWSGTTRTSIQDFGPVRLLVRHSEAVNEEIPGARSRKIDSMFIETNRGERFRVPYNKLSLGRALAQHLAHDGYMHDDAGQHIVAMVEEMNNLAFFVRHTKHRQFEDAQTKTMIEAAAERYNNLRGTMLGLGRTSRYQQFAENFQVAYDESLDYDIEELKERFVKRILDDRVTAALPYVYKAYQNRSISETEKLSNELGDWADNTMQESDWAGPDSDEAVDELRNLMSKPIKAGDSGIGAKGLLYDIIGSDSLEQSIEQASQAENGSEIDVRPQIVAWLEANNYPQLASEFKQALAQEFTSQTQKPMVDPAAQEQTEPQRESLDFLRTLSGIKR